MPPEQIPALGGTNANVSKKAYVWADLERTAGALIEEDVRGTVGVRFGF